MAEIDIESFAADEAYNWLMAVVVPRPIAFVTTLGANGIVNAAPFSSLVTLSPDPPMVGFVIGGREGRKQTLANIEASGEFVVNTVTTEIAEAVQRCADPALAGTAKLASVGLETIPSACIKPPRVATSPIALECRLERIVPFGTAPDQLIAGRIVRLYVRDDVLRNGRVQAGAWPVVGRIGGRTYCRVREFFET